MPLAIVFTDMRHNWLLLFKRFDLSPYRKLFKQTAIYGLATVLPRMLSFFLVPLYTQMLPSQADYGRITIIFSYIIFINVVLAYGMETAFFRFFNKEEDKENVIETSTISIFWSSIIFLVLGLVFNNTIAAFVQIEPLYIKYAIWILALDALVVVPFAKLRALQKPMTYAFIKIGNVAINLLLNVFFLIYLPRIAEHQQNGFLPSIYLPNFQIGYIFISNIAASAFTFLALSRNYLKVSWKFDFKLWRKMLSYGLPILVAGIAFAINDQFDKILLGKLLPADIAESEVGVYSACYKLGLFMVLFRTAYSLGIEPFFFSHASAENAKQTYATITKYFVITGSLMMLAVIVFADVLKYVLLRNPEYWQAMKVVPLIILANFFLGVYTNLSVWYKLIDKTHIGAWISILGAVVTLALNFLLIPSMSYYGSAIATIAAYFTMMVVSYYLGNKYYPIPYDMKMILSYLGISIVFCAISFYYFRENYYVGGSLLLAFSVFIYVNEKPLIKRMIGQKTIN